MKTLRDVFAMRWYWWVALAAIIFAAFLLRFAAYDHPMARNGGDGSMNYLVADHVLRGEPWPAAGPSNAFVAKVGNSPFYYYLVIAMTAMWHSFDGVAILYMFLECVPILCLFFVGRLLFNNVVGLMAMSMLAFSSAYVAEAAGFLWQPYVMECFLIPAILLLVLAWKLNRIGYLFAGQALFVASIALHMSAVALLPLYLVFSWACARRIGNKKAAWISIGITALLFVVFFLPNVFNASRISYLANDFSPRAPSEQTLYGFVWNLTSRIYDDAPMYALPIIILLASIFYLRFRRIGVSDEDRGAFAALWVVVISVSAFNLAFIFFSSAGSPTRYFVPMYWALALISTSIVERIFLRRKYVRLVGIALIALWVSQAATSSVIAYAIGNIPSFDRPRTVAVLRAGESAVRDIVSLRERYGYGDYQFFGVYGIYVSGYATSAVLWHSIERGLDTYFSDFQNRGYSNQGYDFIFLFCAKSDMFTSGLDEGACLEKFARNKPNYAIEKEVYQSEYISVFLARDSNFKNGLK